MMHLTVESGLGRALERFHPLSGKRVALLEADGLNFERLTELSEAFALAGAEVVLVGPTSELCDSQGRSIVQVDRTLHDSAPEAYYALCIPGSVAAIAALRRSCDALHFVRGFVRDGKWVATLDHGPLLLEWIGIAAGRTVTSDPALRAELESAGAAWVSDPVIADQRLVTAQGEAQLEAFVRVATLIFQEKSADPQRGYH